MINVLFLEVLKNVFQYQSVVLYFDVLCDCEIKLRTKLHKKDLGGGGGAEFVRSTVEVM